MMKGVMGQQISSLTVIVVHSTMHLMHHNHCQITTIYIHVQFSYLQIIKLIIIKYKYMYIHVHAHS